MLNNSLIASFVNGDHASFSKIYQYFSKKVLGLCVKYTHSVEVAEELTHDIFLKVWQKREPLQSENLEGFIFRVAKNQIFDWLRKMAADRRMKAEMINRHNSNQAGVQQDEALEAKVDLTFIKSLISNMPPKRREVFQLCKFEQLTYLEVADKLNISRDTVKDHIMKANKALSKIQESEKLLYSLIFLFCFGFIR